MNQSLRCLLALAALAGASTIPAKAQAPAAAPCAADSNFQRLAFWIGDWDVVDSTGAHYATQTVKATLDDCAIAAEWNGGGGNHGLNLSAFDRRSAEWRQMYVSNQVPSPAGVQIRRSDPTYHGPGIRFVALQDPPPEVLRRSRVTIMPMSDHRVMQLFEDSPDGGKTWVTQFKAEHRPHKSTTGSRG